MHDISLWPLIERQTMTRSFPIAHCLFGMTTRFRINDEIPLICPSTKMYQVLWHFTICALLPHTWPIRLTFVVPPLVSRFLSRIVPAPTQSPTRAQTPPYTLSMLAQAPRLRWRPRSDPASLLRQTLLLPPPLLLRITIRLPIAPANISL